MSEFKIRCMLRYVTYAKTLIDIWKETYLQKKTTKENYQQKKRTKETNESKTHLVYNIHTHTHSLSLSHTHKHTHPTHTHTHTHIHTHTHMHTRTHTHVLDLQKAMHLMVCHICQKIERLLYISLDLFRLLLYLWLDLVWFLTVHMFRFLHKRCKHMYRSFAPLKCRAAYV